MKRRSWPKYLVVEMSPSGIPYIVGWRYQKWDKTNAVLDVERVYVVKATKLEKAPRKS